MATFNRDYPTQTDMSPAAHIELITPSDTTIFSIPTRGISFNNIGTLKVTPVSIDPSDAAQAVIIPSGALCSGVIHPIRVIKVWATDTTVLGVVAYY